MVPEGVISAAVLAGALAVDRVFGDPPNRLHPVSYLGRFIGWWGDPGRWDPRVQRAAGVLCTLLTAGLFALPFLFFSVIAPPVLLLLGAPFLLKITLAWRALEEHARAVEEGLGKGVEDGRKAVARMVSRDAGTLSREETLSAAYESVSENLVDSITAPLLYYALLAPFGLGLPAAAFYRAVNTMDAMLGYRDERERIGWFPARMDDLLTYLPARLTGLVLLAYFAAKGRFTPALRAFRRDAGKRPGVNGGIPMAIIAGGTGVRFEKPGVYTMGDAERPLAEGGAAVIGAVGAATLLFSALLAAALFLLG